MNRTIRPDWRVRLADDIDTSAITIFAATATDAAEDFCRSVDAEWEYPIANSGGIDLIVIAPDGEEIQVHVEVRAATYTATKGPAQWYACVSCAWRGTQRVRDHVRELWACPDCGRVAFEVAQ